MKDLLKFLTKLAKITKTKTEIKQMLKKHVTKLLKWKLKM